MNTSQDGLLVTLNERGSVDRDYLAGRLHRKVRDFLPDLQGTIFLNPQTHCWETEDDYLAGNVRANLAVAGEHRVEEDARLVVADASSRGLVVLDQLRPGVSSRFGFHEPMIHGKNLRFTILDLR